MSQIATPPIEPVRLTGLDRLNYERSTTEPYSTAFGWRTMINLVWPMAGWTAVVALVLAGNLNVWLGTILAAAILQALYMPVHEAVHRTISAGRRQWTWIDRAVGSIGAWMLLSSFVEHRHTHLLHHTHTNGEGDPDVLTAEGTPLQIVGRIVVGAIVFPFVTLASLLPGGERLLPSALRKRLAAAEAFRSPEARRAARLVSWSHLAALLAVSLAGFAVEAWLLFYVAGWLARMYLSVIFAWLPHHPHEEQGRYRDTRVFTFRGSGLLARGHDYHLLHHLFPRVPHYRLASLWNDMRWHLVAQGARIEGRAARELGIDPQ
jgi:beta-carotene hydroxylase